MDCSHLFAKAFEAARAGLLFLERDSGRILEANASFLEICGRAREDVIGRIFWEPPMVADGSAGTEMFEHLRAGGVVEEAELPLETGDGSCVLLGVRSKELASDVIQLEIEDATTRERARLAERREAQRAFAGRVAAEFMEMRRALQAAGEVVAGCGQQGKTSFAEADQIREAVNRANGIARELLAFTGQLVMEPSAIRLNELIGGMRPELERIVGPDIRIVLELDQTLEPVMADPAQVRQIILKLAANSRDAMEQGGTLRIATSAAAADDPAIGNSGGRGFAVLQVRDSGPGLDDESWAHLFEPFFTTKAGGKHGLGLAAVHGIVRQSGGLIWADSRPESGTSFRIYLPRGGELSGQKPSFGGPSLLVVAKDDGLRGAVTSILTKHGYRVLEAREPEEARAIAETQGARTLFLNGHAKPPQAGTATLNKPFELDKLLETVRRLLEQ